MNRLKVLSTNIDYLIIEPVSITKHYPIDIKLRENLFSFQLLISMEVLFYIAAVWRWFVLFQYYMIFGQKC